MRAFRFRAQAALDLRTRQLEDAQRELARVQDVRDAARRRVADANEAVARAREEASEAQRSPGDASRLEWYRVWMIRLTHERTAYASTLAARDQDVARAAAACLRAQQRRESLERFREKAHRTHAAAQQSAETKTIDELATRRFSRNRNQGFGIRDQGHADPGSRIPNPSQRSIA